MRTQFASALLATVLLAGCGGAGSGGVLTNPGGGNPGGGSQSQSTTQAEAQSSMGTVQDDNLTVGLFDGTAGATLNVAKRNADVASGSCRDGVERTVTHVSSTETIYETKYFYEDNCTVLAKDVISDVVQSRQHGAWSAQEPVRDHGSARQLLSGDHE
jgi:hypothetical protein